MSWGEWTSVSRWHSTLEIKTRNHHSGTSLISDVIGEAAPITRKLLNIFTWHYFYSSPMKSSYLTCVTCVWINDTGISVRVVVLVPPVWLQQQSGLMKRGALSEMFCSIKLKAENFCTVCSQLLRLAGVSSSGRRRAVDTARFWPVNSAVVPMRSPSVGGGGQYWGWVKTGAAAFGPCFISGTLKPCEEHGF